MASLHWGRDKLLLTASREYRLGRNRECEVQLRDEKSSRSHARVFFEQGEWWVQDLDSANGTKVNGLALITGACKLKSNDVISIGQVQLHFSLEDPKPDLARPSSSAVAEDEQALVGLELGEVKLEQFVARGVTGPLFRAWSERRQHHLMVKLLDRRLLSQPNFADRFQRDLTMAASIEHPGVVRIFRCGSDKQQLWYSMELVEGQTLAQRLQHPLAVDEAIAICLELGEIILAYHERGLVHGDVKPASACQVGKILRLLDIGLIGLSQQEAQLMQSDGNTRQIFYTCPVQARTGQCNARGDIYSIGCILHHMLVGRPPYIGGNFNEILEAHEQQPIPEIARILKLPPMLDEILAGMLQKDPFFRYNNMRSAMDALRSLPLKLRR